jgi:hypothetical protein
MLEGTSRCIQAIAARVMSGKVHLPPAACLISEPPVVLASNFHDWMGAGLAQSRLHVCIEDLWRIHGDVRNHCSIYAPADPDCDRRIFDDLEMQAQAAYRSVSESPFQEMSSKLASWCDKLREVGGAPDDWVRARCPSPPWNAVGVSGRGIRGSGGGSGHLPLLVDPHMPSEDGPVAVCGRGFHPFELLSILVIGAAQSLAIDSTETCPAHLKHRCFIFLDDSIDSLVQALLSSRLFHMRLVVLNTAPDVAHDLLEYIAENVPALTRVCVNPLSEAGPLDGLVPLKDSAAAWPVFEARARLRILVTDARHERGAPLLRPGDSIRVKCEVPDPSIERERLQACVLVSVAVTPAYNPLEAVVSQLLRSFTSPSWCNNTSPSEIAVSVDEYMFKRTAAVRLSCALLNPDDLELQVAENGRKLIPLPAKSIFGLIEHKLLASVIVSFNMTNSEEDSTRQRLKNVPTVLPDPRCSLWNLNGTLPNLTSLKVEGPCPLIGHRDALQCMSGKRLLFIGDSLMRDLAASLALFLYWGEEAYNEKATGADLELPVKANFILSDRLVRSSSFSENLPAYSFPSSFGDYPPREGNWTIDYLELLVPNHRVVRSVVDKASWAHVMINTGVHDMRFGERDLWNSKCHASDTCIKPNSSKYAHTHVKVMLELPNTTIWMPMNEVCLPRHKLSAENARHLRMYVAESNARALDFLTFHRRRYLNLNAVVADTCEARADGIHDKLWAGMARSRILLHHLCSAAG